MRKHGAPLITPLSEAGIISLELAKTEEAANIILNQWKTDAVVQQAITNTWIDFVFLLFYALFLYAYCVYISKQQVPWAATVSRILAIAALVAGLCDVIENYFLLQMLQQSVTASYAFLSWLFAMIKFGLLLPVVVWCLYNLPVACRKE